MMKKFTSLLIGCSLALAVSVMAQVPEEQGTPKGEKQEKTHEAKQPATGVAKPEATTAVREHGVKTEGATSKALKTEGTPKTQTLKSEKTTGAETKASGKMSSETNVSGEASATPGAKHEMGEHGKGAKGAGMNAKTSPSATPATATSSATPGRGIKGAKTTATPVTAAASATPATSATPMTSATASASPITAASASPTASVAATGQANAGAAAKKPDPQQVQQIKKEHENFKAQPKPDKVPPVTFNANFRLEGSDRWQGSQYDVYRSYHPERHDRGWYRSHHNRVELIGGGYYYFDNGYWYPAWGYDSSAEYYAYDAPIYVGHRAVPPDRVIADVQAVLQNMGYYRGEVDGLLGPLTREALTAYQADHGLYTTAVIDEPTLDSLDMG